MESPKPPNGSPDLVIPQPFHLVRIRNLLMAAVENGSTRGDTEYLDHLAQLARGVAEAAGEQSRVNSGV
ncbi:hypothetical protein JN531_004595 [Flagellatimonas centrodinii]|uniref:hypothetical protein n=1 Tax=Flagellatimonas centrodinii TaxID=2806210 RepID=UPI001FEFE675|nr:hypothetical protein [Flagellatimonas centrodinii]ULQ47566.1 hypothetical protein JN531_004595 [Flagellatimonas centrodinii]